MDQTTLPIAATALIARFDAPGVRALVLVGSFARGDAGPHSDIDLLRFVHAEATDVSGSGSYLIDGWLVNVSDVQPPDLDRWFAQPDEAVVYVPGLRTAQPLFDRDGAFAAAHERAHAFAWDAAMQQRADQWASAQMIGWIEEAHKGLEGLRRGDVGRMLSARFGLSWGLQRVVQVQRGVLLRSGDNSFWNDVAAYVGTDSEWVRLRAAAFGAVPLALPEQIIAGLRLYIATVDLIRPAIQPQHAPLIGATVARIRAAL